MSLVLNTPRRRAGALILALAAGSTPAGAQGDALRRCPKLADPAARLACYDAVMPPEAAPPAAAVAPAVRAPATATVPMASSRSDDFGLPAKPQAGAPEGVESTVAADFEGWGPNTRIRLQNGQVWEVVDSSSGTVAPGSNRKVRVTRSLFGSFVLEFEGLTKTPKVRRVQ